LILMAVYNDLEKDGRVQRSATALAKQYEVIVVSVASQTKYSNDSYQTKEISIPSFIYLRSLRLFYFWVCIVYEAIKSRPTILYMHDFFLSLPGYLGSRLAGARCIYDSHELIIPGGMPGEGLRGMFFYFLERMSIKNFDLVIAANQERALAMQQHYRLQCVPLVVQNVLDKNMKSISDEELISIYPVLQPNDRIRLIYQGALGPDRGLDAFIMAMKFLEDGYEMIIVGGGPDVERLKQQAENAHCADRVIFLGLVPRGHLQGIMETAHIGIVTYTGKGLNSIYCAPNKIYEYAQAGLPVITTNQPTIRNIMHQHQIGLIISSDGAEKGEDSGRDVAQIVQCLARDIKRYKNNLRLFIEENDWSTQEHRLCEAIQKL